MDQREQGQEQESGAGAGTEGDEERVRAHGVPPKCAAAGVGEACRTLTSAETIPRFAPGASSARAAAHDTILCHASKASRALDLRGGRGGPGWVLRPW